MNNNECSSVRRKRPRRLFGRWFVKKRLQIKFSIYVLLLMTLGALCLWILGNVAILKMVGSGLVNDESLISILETLNQMVFFGSLFIYAFLFGLSIVISHLVAGPIYRFERTLEQIEDGDLTMTVRLRKNDELQEVAQLFNRALTGLRDRLNREKEALTKNLNRIQVLSNELKQSENLKVASDLDQVISDIKALPPQVKTGTTDGNEV